MKAPSHKRRSPLPPALFLGIDCGGSHTVAQVSDSRGRRIGRASGGPSNPITMGLAPAEREILTAARRALAGAGRGVLKAVCLGVAGGDRPEVARPLEAWVRRRLPAQVHRVTTDAAVALEAA
ncbi:MAG TPA: hypothetical protein VL523_13860, partial [Terriglobia bacterium]|nr:hypothetical protein [Terriglobia bacterium]